MDIKITKEFEVLGEQIYQIDNFYSNPGFVLDMVTSAKLDWFKTSIVNGVDTCEPIGTNGIQFEDKRHIKQEPRLVEYADKLVEMFPFMRYYTDREEELDPAVFKTNAMRWFDIHGTKPYKDHYWYPHYDHGWTVIVYLNEATTNGTNIYTMHDKDWYEAHVGVVHEHIQPWVTKEQFTLEAHLEPAFNRAYLFRGGKLLHGAAVDDETYFDDLIRLNQVMFFEDT